MWIETISSFDRPMDRPQSDLISIGQTRRGSDRRRTQDAAVFLETQQIAAIPGGPPSAKTTSEKERDVFMPDRVQIALGSSSANRTIVSGTSYPMRTKRTDLPRHERLIEARSRLYPGPTAASRAFGWPKETLTQHENGTRPLSRKAAEKYAAAFGVGAGWLLYGDRSNKGSKGPFVRFGGVIGAGQQVFPSDQLDGTTEGTIADEDAEAFEVMGDSMLPLAQPGDVVFFGSPRPPARLIGRECLVEMIDGMRLFKTIERGSRPGLFDLISYNASPLRDVEIVKAGPFLGVRRK